MFLLYSFLIFPPCQLLTLLPFQQQVSASPYSVRCILVKFLVPSVHSLRYQLTLGLHLLFSVTIDQYQLGDIIIVNIIIYLSHIFFKWFIICPWGLVTASLLKTRGLSWGFWQNLGWLFSAVQRFWSQFRFLWVFYRGL